MYTKRFLYTFAIRRTVVDAGGKHRERGGTYPIKFRRHLLGSQLGAVNEVSVPSYVEYLFLYYPTDDFLTRRFGH